MFTRKLVKNRWVVMLGIGWLLFATANPDINHSFARQATVKFVIDAKQSKFIAHGLRGGLLWFKGHEHLIAVNEFSGDAEITSGTILPASLRVTIQAASLEETSSVFSSQQKQIINKELRDIVFHPDKYPEITFRSTSVSGKNPTGGRFEVKIRGDLTLHGVTRPVTIPATGTINGDTLRAVGEFSIDRSDFNVKATSAFHGLVRVRNKVKLEFDVVARRV